MPFVTRTRRDTPETIPKLPGLSIPFTRSSIFGVVHVLEKPPMTVGVSFKMKLKTRKGTWSKKGLGFVRWKIKVPWQYFMVRMNRVGAITDTFIWFAQKQISDLSEPVYMPPLPNIYPSGHICNGTIRVSLSDPPHVRVARAFESFWTTPFTEETWPETGRLVPKCWQQSSHYVIEYGYLKYVFEYWQEHDAKHATSGWLEDHGSCSFPWRLYQVRNKAMEPWHEEVIHNLGEAMEYALDFVQPNRHPDE